MPQSYAQYAANGSNRGFSVPFPYINKAHVRAKVDGVIVTFTWSNDSFIQLDATPAAGTVVEVRRVTPNDVRAVDFVDGSTLTESDLDQASIQFLYLSQEAQDRADEAPRLTAQNTYDFQGRRGTNLADPVADQDAATKVWVANDVNSSVTRSRANADEAGSKAAQAGTSAGNAASSATAAKTAQTAAENAAANPDLSKALTKAQNLADVADKASARGNLGLKGAATREVGVTGGVASFDDPRFPNGTGGASTVDGITDASTSGKAVMKGTPEQGRNALELGKTAFPSFKGLTAPVFAGVTPRIVVGHNPANQQGFSDTKNKSPITFLVDLGYGDPSFSNLATPEAITGAISMPADAVMYNHVAGVAGYAKNYAADQNTRPGAVGVYGEGNAMVPNVNVWGLNTRTNDNGNSTNAIWGYECDINVNHKDTFARGIDIVGGSSVQFDQASPAIIIQSPGVGYSGTANPIRWGRGVYLADESSYRAIEVGTAFIQPNVGSMPITFMCRNGSAREEAFRIYASGNNTAIEATSNNSLIRLRTKAGGNNINALSLVGNNVGLGSLSDVPQYTADVGGSLRAKGEARFEGSAAFFGNVGFFGTSPVSKPVITGQLSQNEDMLARIINALVALGLVTNNTTY